MAEAHGAGIPLGAPHVDISTQNGAGFTWVRTTTTSWAITGTKGTTAVQTFTSTLSASGLALRETASPGADTNRVAYIGSSNTDAGKQAAQIVTLAISDVPHDDPSAIASGPTVPDPTTLADARGIVAAWEEGQGIDGGSGVVSYRGRMVEALHVDSARRTLAVHEAILAL